MHVSTRGFLAGGEHGAAERTTEAANGETRSRATRTWRARAARMRRTNKRELQHGPPVSLLYVRRRLLASSAYRHMRPARDHFVASALSLSIPISHPLALTHSPALSLLLCPAPHHPIAVRRHAPLSHRVRRQSLIVDPNPPRLPFYSDEGGGSAVRARVVFRSTSQSGA